MRFEFQLMPMCSGCGCRVLASDSISSTRAFLVPLDINIVDDLAIGDNLPLNDDCGIHRAVGCAPRWPRKFGQQSIQSVDSAPASRSADQYQNSNDDIADGHSLPQWQIFEFQVCLLTG
jgi:hypothetical protein